MDIRFLNLKFNKIDAYRSIDFKGDIKIRQNIKINTLEKFKSLNTKEETTKITYSFEISYGDLGYINIEGLLFISTDLKTQKNLIKNFEDKNINMPENISLMNIIIQKTSIKAAQLEEELSLPVHIKIPLLKLKEN